MNNLLFLLDVPATGQGFFGNGSMSWIFIILIIIVFYFFLIRPQHKRQKQIEEYRKTLSKGDKIITIGGLHGKIVDVQENVFVIEIADGVKITIEKAAVAFDENEAKNAQKK